MMTALADWMAAQLAYIEKRFRRLIQLANQSNYLTGSKLSTREREHTHALGGERDR